MKTASSLYSGSQFWKLESLECFLVTGRAFTLCSKVVYKFVLWTHAVCYHVPDRRSCLIPETDRNVLSPKKTFKSVKILCSWKDCYLRPHFMPVRSLISLAGGKLDTDYSPVICHSVNRVEGGKLKGKTTVPLHSGRSTDTFKLKSDGAYHRLIL